MRPPAKRRAPLVAAILLLAACSSPNPTGAPASGSAPASASASAAATGPGRPYGAEQILEALRASTRLGGVPDDLETPEVAGAIAEQLWTFTGEPWEAFYVTSRCPGNDTCILELFASASGSEGADSYAFSVTRDDGHVELTGSDLAAVPASALAELDAAIRAGVPASRLEGMAAVGVRWQLPPEQDRLWVSYRSGGEEGSPSLGILVERTTGAVLQVVQRG
ncbi:MAG TPA: hypothetical protein VF013_10170 [Candidatus Limnocylindria bacterium]